MANKLPIDRVARSALILLAVGVIFSGDSLAQPTLVFIANYDAKLTVAGAEHHVSSQAKVRNGRTIPIELQTHRIDVTLVSAGDGRYDAVVNVYEQGADEWHRITLEDLTFEAVFAAPINLQWHGDDTSMDLAIAVSISGQ